jgi:hypothetical protein
MLQFIVPMESRVSASPAPTRRPRLDQPALHVTHVEIFADQFRDDTENQAMKLKELLDAEIVAGVALVAALLLLGFGVYYFLK